jgi:hypothetical protein
MQCAADKKIGGTPNNVNGQKSQNNLEGARGPDHIIVHLLLFKCVPASDNPKLKGILLFLLTKSMFL